MATATIAAVGLAAGLHGALYGAYSMRMFLELLFKILVRDYLPGKFMSLTVPYLQWAARRRYFIVTYAVTWLLYVAFCSHADW